MGAFVLFAASVGIAFWWCHGLENQPADADANGENEQPQQIRCFVIKLNP